MTSALDIIISSLLIPIDTNSILIAFLHIYAVIAYQSPSFYWVPENFYDLPISSSLFTTYRILQAMIKWHLLDWHINCFALNQRAYLLFKFCNHIEDPGTHLCPINRETHFILSRIIFFVYFRLKLAVSSFKVELHECYMSPALFLFFHRF